MPKPTVLKLEVSSYGVGKNLDPPNLYTNAAEDIIPNKQESFHSVFVKFMKSITIRSFNNPLIPVILPFK